MSIKGFNYKQTDKNTIALLRIRAQQLGITHYEGKPISKFLKADYVAAINQSKRKTATKSKTPKQATTSQIVRKTNSCDSEKKEGKSDRIYSENLFNQVNNWRDFVALWNKFYRNEICTPLYYGPWVGEGSDNKYASFEIGQTYADLSNTLGIVFTNGQQASIEDEQREYLDGTAPRTFRPLMIAICEFLNRYSGMVAFYYIADWNYRDLTKKALQKYEGEDGIDIPNQMRGFAITYDYDKKNGINKSETFNIGSSYSFMNNLGADGNQILDNKWLNPTLTNKLRNTGFVELKIVDTQHGSGRIVPLLKRFVELIQGGIPQEFWNL